MFFPSLPTKKKKTEEKEKLSLKVQRGGLANMFGIPMTPPMNNSHNLIVEILGNIIKIKSIKNICL